MTTHNFKASLALSRGYADAPWWEEIYRQAFPSFAAMAYVADDCPAQRDGVDRVVTTSGGHVYRIDEKVREKDWNDFFLEYWSDEGRQLRGWVAKDLGCNYIAYAFVPSRTCYLLPFQLLRCAWRRHHREWVEKFRQRRVKNAHYVTVGVPVPIDVVLKAIGEAMQFSWAGISPATKHKIVDISIVQ